MSLREAAADLITTVEFAIKAGDWKVDGACDPTLDIQRLRQALAQPDEVLAEREACAKIVEAEASQYVEPTWAFEIINDIKARGKK